MNRSWTEEMDVTLVDRVHESLEEGSTKSNAFRKIAEEFGKTPGAVAFRWNSHIVKKYPMVKHKQLFLSKWERNSNVSSYVGNDKVVSIHITKQAVSLLEELVNHKAIMGIKIGYMGGIDNLNMGETIHPQKVLVYSLKQAIILLDQHVD